MAEKTIVIKDSVFNPPSNDTFVIQVGDTVVWDNQDNMAHNVRSLGSPAFSLDPFGPGKTQPVGPFLAPTDQNGVPYTCDLHANMNGRLVVVLAGSSLRGFSNFKNAAPMKHS
jgi:plastocyanin